MALTANQKQYIRKNVGNRKLKRPPKWLFPTNIEKKYKRALVKYVREFFRIINEQLTPAIKPLLDEAQSTFYVDSKETPRNDDFLDLLNNIIEGIEISLKPFTDDVIEESELIANQISDFNQEQFQKINRSVFGIDIFAEEPYLSDQLEIFSNQNAQLIKSIPEQELLQVSGIIQRGMAEGKRFTEVSKELKKRFGVTSRRANLIARDQTTKLNSDLTRLRQQNAGIETYRWSTAGDERVRHSHVVMNGKTCRWDDSTVWLDKSSGKWVKRNSEATKNHVGIDINCRCVAIPIMEGILE